MAKATASGNKASAAKQAAPAKKTAAPAKKTAAPARKAPAPATKSASGAATKASSATKASAATKSSATKKAPAAKATASRPPAAKAPAARKPRSPFPARWLAAQHQALLDERATYLHQAESLQAEADSLVADFESGDVQFDEESGEGDTLNIERERDLTLSAQARAAVEEIDHALAKFDLGTYGICETSGEPIPMERLEAIPWARQRVEFNAAGLGHR